MSKNHTFRSLVNFTYNNEGFLSGEQIQDLIKNSGQSLAKVSNLPRITPPSLSESERDIVYKNIAYTLSGNVLGAIASGRPPQPPTPSLLQSTLIKIGTAIVSSVITEAITSNLFAKEPQIKEIKDVKAIQSGSNNTNDNQGSSNNTTNKLPLNSKPKELIPGVSHGQIELGNWLDGLAPVENTKDSTSVRFYTKQESNGEFKAGFAVVEYKNGEISSIKTFEHKTNLGEDIALSIGKDKAQTATLEWLAKKFENTLKEVAPDLPNVNVIAKGFGETIKKSPYIHEAYNDGIFEASKSIAIDKFTDFACNAIGTIISPETPGISQKLACEIANGIKAAWTPIYGYIEKNFCEGSCFKYTTDQINKFGAEINGLLQGAMESLYKANGISVPTSDPSRGR
ncbi:MAG: hypothetical protein J0H68_05190 [Sphingobacteriia bacterium]|nr:hypothetical protein [Sphingobacteriia bacterium]